MYPRSPLDYETKSIFYYFLAISCILHLIFIFTSASLSQFFKPKFSSIADGSKKEEYIVEVSFETKQEEREEDEIQEIVKEEEIEKKLIEEEEKREVFVDTSEKVTNETPQDDTEKIGEVGSVAKDMYAGQEDMNSEPRLTDDTQEHVVEPEYRTAILPQQADVQLEPQIQTLSPMEEERENRFQEEEIQEEIVASTTVETAEEVEEKREAQAIEESDTLMNSEESLEKSVAKVIDGDIAHDQSEKDEELDIETTSFDSDVVVPQNMPVQENLDNEIKTEEEVVAEDDKVELEAEAEDVALQKRVETVTDKEHIKLVSIPKESTNQIAKDYHQEEVQESMQENIKRPEEQLNTISPSDTVQAPFFEDNISNAPVQGSESFNIKKHEYAPYYKHIRDKIRLFWLVQYGTDASINLVTKEYKPVVVEFKVLPSGKIINVVISKTAGNDLLASKVQTSVQNTMLDKFPDYVNEKFINVRFNFYFF